MPALIVAAFLGALVYHALLGAQIQGSYKGDVGRYRGVPTGALGYHALLGDPNPNPNPNPKPNPNLNPNPDPNPKP